VLPPPLPGSQSQRRSVPQGIPEDSGYAVAPPSHTTTDPVVKLEMSDAR
jgi:hypothetical protein